MHTRNHTLVGILDQNDRIQDIVSSYYSQKYVAAKSFTSIEYTPIVIDTLESELPIKNLLDSQQILDASFKNIDIVPLPPQPAFTTGNDFVDFNNLKDSDYPWGQYNALAGDDVVIMPYNVENAWNANFQPLHDFHGDAGNDIIVGAGLMDYLYGDTGNDHIYGGDAMDYLDGGAGNDQLDGGSANDRLNGHTGDDHLNGGKGNDSLFGGAGDDTIFGGLDNDVIYGDATIDQLSPNQSQEIGNDTLMGGNGNDELWGGRGDDTLMGGSGTDHLLGGAGMDILTGGSGKDIFYFSNGDGTIENLLFSDIITDFQNGVDLLKLYDGLTFSDLMIEDVGADCRIYVKNTYEHLVLIKNAAGQIDFSDFA